MQAANAAAAAVLPGATGCPPLSVPVVDGAVLGGAVPVEVVPAWASCLGAIAPAVELVVVVLFEEPPHPAITPAAAIVAATASAHAPTRGLRPARLVSGRNTGRRGPVSTGAG
jgi:hypothetical protein